MSAAMKVFTILTTVGFITTGCCLSTNDPKCPKDNGETILLPNTDDCSSYWACTLGYPILQVCPHGKLFDVLNLSCGNYETAVCAGEKPVKPPVTTTVETTLPESTTTTTVETTLPESTTITTVETTLPESTTITTVETTLPESTTITTVKTTLPESETNPSEKYPVYCPPQIEFEDNYFLPNPKDCHSFYHCSYGIPYLQYCPNNLVFNPKKSVCDWPSNVHCDAQN